MTNDRPISYLVSLVRELCKLPRETEWAEFKVNNANPAEIGEYISALSNAAALAGKTFGYLVWGISNEDHSLVGTTFLPFATKLGNEELESWLLQGLSPKIHFRFFEVAVEGCPIVILEIEGSVRQPVQFKSVEFIRVGSYKKPLKNFPEKERSLWRLFDKSPFENGIAADRLCADDVMRLLDTSSYFELLNLPIPQDRRFVLECFESERLIAKSEVGDWNITNLGAILFAKRLDEFGGLKRKALRIMCYKNNSKNETIKEHLATQGYATGFESTIAYINGILPSNEVVGQALRKTVPMFPELAIRELVANAIIHQDFAMTGVAPTVEIFSNRIEITNPGSPLMDTRRFVDTPPRSRNETLASLLRRIGVCEERGSGWDKVVFQTELFQLPAPLIEVLDNFTRVVLFAHQDLTKMEKSDRVRATYLHSCLRYVNREPTNNTSLRERFGIEVQNSALASRLLREAVEAGMIAPHDVKASTKLMRYIPFWAVPAPESFP
jgi:ATP-dependent DNA helicase RecG